MQVIVGNAVVIENTIIFEIIDEENFCKRLIMKKHWFNYWNRNFQAENFLILNIPITNLIKNNSINIDKVNFFNNISSNLSWSDVWIEFDFGNKTFDLKSGWLQPEILANCFLRNFIRNIFFCIIYAFIYTYWNCKNDLGLIICGMAKHRKHFPDASESIQ